MSRAGDAATSDAPLSPTVPHLSAEEANIAFDDLTFGAAIGEGAFGRVCRGSYRGADVAIKALALRALQNASMIKYLHSELSVLGSVSHPHLIKYYGAAQRGKDVFIVTEYLEGGSLAGVLAAGAPLLPWSLLVALGRAAAEGLAHLHAAELLHRDIKTENLLLADDWRLVVADYGFAKKVADLNGGVRTAMTILGTEDFMAPEVTFGEAYGVGADVFSLGCVLVELLTRQPPGAVLQRTPRNKFAANIEALRAAAPADAPPSFVECAVQCLAYEPEARVSADVVADWLRELEAEVTALELAMLEAEPPVRLKRADVGAPSTIAARAMGGGGGAHARDSGGDTEQRAVSH